MQKEEALQAIASWPIEDRIEFLQEAWDQVVDAGWQPPLAPDLQTTLDQRIDAANAHPDEVLTWETIVEYVRRPQ